MDLILDRLSELETLWRQLIKTDKEPDLQEQDSQLAQQRAREIEVRALYREYRLI